MPPDWDIGWPDPPRSRYKSGDNFEWQLVAIGYALFLFFILLGSIL